MFSFSWRGLGILSLALLLLSCQSAADSMLTRVRLETSLGDIVVEVDSRSAPITASNFLRYVEEDFYSGGTFYRTVRMDNQPNNDVRIEVIQGGANSSREGDAYAPIEMESTDVTGILHLNGVISMARLGPDTATHEFFICIGDQPSLDFGGARNPDGQGFAAFGRVLSGMDVVRRIQAGKDSQQTLEAPILIQRAGKI